MNVISGSLPETTATPPIPSTRQRVPASFSSGARIAVISVPFAPVSVSIPSPSTTKVASPCSAAPSAFSIWFRFAAAHAIIVIMIGEKVTVSPSSV